MSFRALVFTESAFIAMGPILICPALVFTLMLRGVKQVVGRGLKTRGATIHACSETLYAVGRYHAQAFGQLMSEQFPAKAQRLQASLVTGIVI